MFVVAVKPLSITNCGSREINTDDNIRPAGVNVQLTRSEQSVVAAISQKDIDTRMTAIMAVYEKIAEQSKKTKASFKATSGQVKKTGEEVKRMFNHPAQQQLGRASRVAGQ